MCKYCKVDENGTSDQTEWTIDYLYINGVEIYCLTFYADEAKLLVTSDLKDSSRNIKIKYCPMCGRKF